MSLRNSIARDLQDHGFDICHSFHPQWYNDCISTEKKDSLLTKLPSSPSHAALLVGNTKHLWPYFLDWCSQKQQSENELLPSDPLDKYCQEKIGPILQKHFETRNPKYWYKVIWASEPSPQRLVSMQRVAMTAGLAYFDTNTYLTIHPVYGAWHSYRAVVVYCNVGGGIGDDDDDKNYRTLPEPQPLPPSRVPCPMSALEQERARDALQHALQLSSDCGSESSSSTTYSGGKEEKQLRAAEAWIALRDCIEIGKLRYRFDPNQLMYHYTKNIKYIQNAKEERAG